MLDIVSGMKTQQGIVISGFKLYRLKLRRHVVGVQQVLQLAFGFRALQMQARLQAPPPGQQTRSAAIVMPHVTFVPDKPCCHSPLPSAYFRFLA